MEVDKELEVILLKELGKNSADLFVEFYSGFPRDEQIDGARKILATIIGKSRTDELLINIKK